MICPKTKSATHCLTELFPIYQNKHWTIGRWDDHSVNPSSHHIILKIVRFYAKGISVPTSVWAWNPKFFKNTPSEIIPLHCDDGMHFSVSCSFFGKKKYMASRFWIAYFLLSGSDENWSKASSILSRRWWIRPQLKAMSLELRYRTRAIVTRGLYNFYPLFEVHLCTVTFGLMYG